MMAGSCNVTMIDTWSEPVEGWSVSHEATNGERRGFQKARSRTEGLVMVSKGMRE